MTLLAFLLICFKIFATLFTAGATFGLVVAVAYLYGELVSRRVFNIGTAVLGAIALGVAVLVWV